MLRARPARAAVPLLLVAALLTACGGGGGGGGDGGGNPTTPAASPALTFNPATVTASVAAGTSQTLNVIASVVRPADFANAGTVFATLTDTTGVIQPTAQVVRDSDTQYHAVLQTAPALAAGNYKGNFSVKLCRDNGCASQFPGSPMTLPYDITVVPAGSASFSAVSAMPLTASAQLGGAAPAAGTVNITAIGRTWTAGTGGAAWLKLSAASGSGNAALGVSYDAAGLSPGQYATTLTITASDGQKAELPVALTVLPSGLVLGSNSVTFNAVNGAPIASQIVSLDTDNKLSAAWTASSSSAWLKVSPTAGATPATTVLTVDPTIGKLASGSYTGNIVIVPQGLTTRTLPVTLNLIPATLLTSSNSITLGGLYGRSFGGTETLNLSLNTGTNSWPWSLANLPAWATASAASGTVSQAVSSTMLAAKPENATVGVTSSLMSLFATVNGDLVPAPVLLTLNKDRHKLLPSETAVSFVFTPGWERRIRTITVTDNYGNFGGMTATSDQPWLVVGVNGDKLILTADPTPLLTGTLSTATITVKASDPDASAPEPIRVALWKGAATPSAATTAPLPYTSVITDPLRPYAYAHNGGAVIDVYNLYTGAKEASLTGFSARLGAMATSLNGDYLYVIDVDNSRVTTVDLATRAISRQLPLAVPGTQATRLKVVRPNGVEMLLLSDGQAFLTSTFAALPRLPLTTGGTLGASANGKLVVQQDEAGASSVQHTSVALDYAALHNGTLYAAKLPKASHVSPGTLGQDLLVSSDGLLVYSASSTPKSCSVMSTVDLGVQRNLAIGDAAPNNIEVGIDGRIFCGGAVKTGANDIWMYDSTGAMLKQFKLGAVGKQLLPRQLAVSGDGWVLVGITDDGALSILPVGP